MITVKSGSLQDGDGSLCLANSGARGRHCGTAVNHMVARVQRGLSLVELLVGLVVLSLVSVAASKNGSRAKTRQVGSGITHFAGHGAV